MAMDPFSSMCVCLAGYTGPVCETNISNCLNSNCPPPSTSTLDGDDTFQYIFSESDDPTDSSQNSMSG